MVTHNQRQVFVSRACGVQNVEPVWSLYFPKSTAYVYLGNVCFKYFHLSYQINKKITTVSLYYMHKERWNGDGRRSKIKRLLYTAQSAIYVLKMNIEKALLSRKLHTQIFFVERSEKLRRYSAWRATEVGYTWRGPPKWAHGTLLRISWLSTRGWNDGRHFSFQTSRHKYSSMIERRGTSYNYVLVSRPSSRKRTCVSRDTSSLMVLIHKL